MNENLRTLIRKASKFFRHIAKGNSKQFVSSIELSSTFIAEVLRLLLEQLAVVKLQLRLVVMVVGQGGIRVLTLVVTWGGQKQEILVRT